MKRALIAMAVLYGCCQGDCLGGSLIGQAVDLSNRPVRNVTIEFRNASGTFLTSFSSPTGGYSIDLGTKTAGDQGVIVTLKASGKTDGTLTISTNTANLVNAILPDAPPVVPMTDYVPMTYCMQTGHRKHHFLRHSR